MADDVITPGPCPPEGCPPPTEIDCIEVNKVYDFCFQTEAINASFDIPDSCGTVPTGSTVAGTVSSVSCTMSSITPIEDSGGFANVTLLVVSNTTFTITAPDGTTICTFTGTHSFYKTVTLCAPTGVSVDCSAPSTSVSPAMIVGGAVMAVVNLCLLIESTALVKILIPTYGFCVPAPCVVLPTPPFACPPSPLYPPQCPTTFPTTPAP